MVSAPPSGIASRALIAALSIAVSSWVGIDLDRPQAGARSSSTSIWLPSVRDSTSPKASSRTLRSITSGLSGWRRPKASRWLVRVGGAVGGLDDRVEIAARFSSLRSAAQQVGRAADHGHQIVEVVRDAAGQLAERLQLLRLEQRRARLLELHLRAWRRSVMSRVILAKPICWPSRRRSDRSRRGPEAACRPCGRAAPPSHICLRAARFPARGRHAARAVLLGVEAREMLADDLLGRIALDRLGAGIPVADVAAGSSM